MENSTENIVLSLDHLVNLCIEKDASDLHFGEGQRATLRILGQLSFVENMEVLSSEAMGTLLSELFDETQAARFREYRQLDFSYAHKTGVHFRVSAFYHQEKASVVMHKIEKNPPSLDSLGLPEFIKELLSLKQGLILVTGPSKSGKSTTIQAMLNHINQSVTKHIITVEDPVEYVLAPEKSIITQREIGRDSLNFCQALHSVSHEDADVVMVSSIPDGKTLDLILNLVEAGHLVIAAVSAKDAEQTLNHLLSLSTVSAELIQKRLADHLLGIFSQTLMPRLDQNGLVPAYEWMLNTDSIRRLISMGQIHQIRAAIQSSEDRGMITLSDYVARLAQQGLIAPDLAQRFDESD